MNPIYDKRIKEAVVEAHHAVLTTQTNELAKLVSGLFEIDYATVLQDIHCAANGTPYFALEKNIRIGELENHHGFYVCVRSIDPTRWVGIQKIYKVFGLHPIAIIIEKYHRLSWWDKLLVRCGLKGIK